MAGKTRKIKIPVAVDLYKTGKITAFVPEITDATKTTKRDVEPGMYEPLDGSIHCEVMWVEAEIPVPKKPVQKKVKGKVVKKKR